MHREMYIKMLKRGSSCIKPRYNTKIQLPIICSVRNLAVRTFSKFKKVQKSHIPDIFLCEINFEHYLFELINPENSNADRSLEEILVPENMAGLSKRDQIGPEPNQGSGS